MSRFAVVVGVLAGLLAVGAGCASGGRHQQAGRTGADGGLPDPCALVTKKEAAAALHVSGVKTEGHAGFFLGTAKPGVRQRACRFVANGSQAVVEVAVGTDPGGADLKAKKAEILGDETELKLASFPTGLGPDVWQLDGLLYFGKGGYTVGVRAFTDRPVDGDSSAAAVAVATEAYRRLR